MGPTQRPRSDKASGRHNDHCHGCSHLETIRAHEARGGAIAAFTLSPFGYFCCMFLLFSVYCFSFYSIFYLSDISANKNILQGFSMYCFAHFTPLFHDEDFMYIGWCSCDFAALFRLISRTFVSSVYYLGFVNVLFIDLYGWGVALVRFAFPFHKCIVTHMFLWLVLWWNWRQIFS